MEKRATAAGVVLLLLGCVAVVANVSQGSIPRRLRAFTMLTQTESASQADGACTNSDDQAKWTAKGSVSFKNDITTCGKKCFGKEAAPYPVWNICVADCIKTTEGYSDSCSTCFGTLANCGRDPFLGNCLSACTASQHACDECVANECNPGFTTCSGLTPPKAKDDEEVAIRIPVSRSYATLHPRHATFSEFDSAETFGVQELTMIADTDIPLYDKFNCIYSSPVQIGSPPQDFVMVYDTGSSNVWAMSSDCADCDGRVTHHHFDSAKSDTYKKTGRTVSLHYGTGSAEGDSAQDTMTVGDLVIENQDIANMYQTAMPFPDQPIDGLVGLGFAGIATPSELVPWLENVKNSGKVTSTILMFEMGTKDGQEGHIVLGSLQEKYYPNGVNWRPVVKAPSIGDFGWWLIDMDGYKVGTKSFTKSSGIVDSGTSFLLMPQAAFAAFKEQLPTSISCDEGGLAKLPKIELIFGGNAYVLEGKDYIITNPLGQCQLAVAPNGVGGDFDWLIGDVFHRKVAVTYDYDNKRVGFPVEKGSSAPPAPNPPHKDDESFFKPAMDWAQGHIEIVIAAALGGWVMTGILCCTVMRGGNRRQQRGMFQ